MSGRLLNRYRDSIAGAKYIGRGSPWGNPFRSGVDGTREEVIARYEQEVLPTLDLTPLLGKDIWCFCAPKACHGDPILRKLYNGL